MQTDSFSGYSRLLPGRARRFTGNEAQARTQIAQRAIDCSVTLAGEAWQLTLEPVLVWPDSAEAAWHVEAQWGGAPFLIQLPASTAQTWIAECFSDLDLPALSPEMTAATLEEALRDAFEALSALERGPAELNRLDQESVPERPVPKHCFLLTLAGEAQRIHGAIATDSLGLMLTAGLFSPLAPVANAIDVESLPILLRAEIGRSTIAASMLASLAVNDVVLIEEAWSGLSGELWLGTDQLGVRVRYEDCQFVVTQSISAIGTIMPTNEPVLENTVASETPAPVDSIPIHLVFDLGERSMSLGELKKLQPGQTLDLGKPLGNVINIRANGALIGYGELIEIDGRLGVTVATLAETPG